MKRMVLGVKPEISLPLMFQPSSEMGNNEFTSACILHLGYGWIPLLLTSGSSVHLDWTGQLKKQMAWQLH